MKSEYLLYTFNSDKRLPKELRTNKQMATDFCNYLKDNKVLVLNKDIFVLAEWVGIDLVNYDSSKNHSRIKSITMSDNEMVADFTIPEDHSYTANGIIVHNCNLPQETTKELVSEVYMKAYEVGCKGFTIYRDGSRSGVLVSTDDAAANKLKDGRPVDIQNFAAPKRPIELPCDIKKAKVNGEAWTIFVGKLNDQVYEVFGGLSKFIDIPNKYKTGKIIKNGKNAEGVTSYNLVVGEGDDQMKINNLAEIFENKTNEAFTRMISLNLRHGTPIRFVVEQLTKDKYAEMTSFSKVISRVLKTYIKDGVVSTDKICAACGEKYELRYQENCLSSSSKNTSCSVCNYSKCS